jgi:hypothetical protein
MTPEEDESDLTKWHRLVVSLKEEIANEKRKNEDFRNEITHLKKAIERMAEQSWRRR